MSIAVIIALVALTVATFANALGLIIMKQIIITHEGLSEANYFKHPKYIGGLLCLVFGALILVGKC
jgi:hypothetical protein